MKKNTTKKSDNKMNNILNLERSSGSPQKSHMINQVSISPKYNIYLVRPNYKTHLITPILGIGYISSYLKRKGYKPKIIDGVNLNMGNCEIAKMIPAGSIVGISILSAYFNEAKSLADILKKKDCLVIAGGDIPFGIWFLGKFKIYDRVSPFLTHFRNNFP